MQNISPEILRQIQEKIKRPVGTLGFSYSSDNLFDSKVAGGILFQLFAGAHIFRIERDDKLRLSFYHSSPGTRTRVATIDLNKVEPSSKVRLIFTWSPSEITFSVGPLNVGDKKVKGELVSAKGVLSPRQFRVGRDGSIIQIGDKGVEVMGLSIYQGGKPILNPTALEAWENTVKAIKILFGGTSEEDLFFDVVTNLTLSILVTGFESFCRTRFFELEQEGITPNKEALVLKFFSRAEHDAGEPDIITSEAKVEGKSFLEKISEKRINFQNYENCKDAYNKAYGVKFGDIGVTSGNLTFLQRLIKYRHRVVHISPLLHMLNQPEVPPEEPVFANKEFGNKALGCFDSFITKLHDATLRLQRSD